LQQPRRPSPLPALVLLTLVAGPLFFARLDAPLLEPQEPRYAEIPRQMLVEGRLLVPVLHGEPYLDKPPLLYWLVMASYALFGVHDWAARLVPGGVGVLTVLLTYLWGRRAAGERAGLCGALVLALSPEFVYRGRMLLMDGLLGLWVTAGLAAAHAALLGPRLRRGWWLLSAAACGLGLLTKGPVALVLVAGPTLGYTLLERRTARPAGRDWVAYLGVSGLVAAPWYGAVVWALPGFARDFFCQHNVVRFVRPFDHQEPAWFYLPNLLLGLLPWTLLLPGLAVSLARRSPEAAARRPPALGFFLLAGLGGLVFFSASGCKRAAYILPALPSLALALGCYLNTLLPSPARWHAWEALWRTPSRLAFGATLVVLLLGLGFVAAAAAKELLPAAAGLLLGGAGLVGLVVVLGARRRASWAGCLAVTFAALLLGVHQLLPAYNRQYALRDDLPPAGGPLRVACYPQRWDSVSFYLPDAEVAVYTAGQRGRLVADLRGRPGTLLVVKSGRPLRELLDELPPEARFMTRGGTGLVTVGHVVGGASQQRPPADASAQRR
jgi:dolichol-phosphate mannosyltransferase